MICELQGDMIKRTQMDTVSNHGSRFPPRRDTILSIVHLLLESPHLNTSLWP